MSLRLTSLNQPTDGRACAFDQMCGDNCIGTDYGGKAYPAEAKNYVESLDPRKAKIWSFGMGGDISFEIGLSCKYQFTIHMFDPSPSVPNHMQAVHKLVGTMNASVWDGPLPDHAKCNKCKNYWNDVARSDVTADKLLFHPMGLADADGNLTFYGYKGMQKSGSYSLDPGMRDRTDVPKIVVPVKSFQTLSHEFGFEALDILKIDVEGLETKMIDQLFKMPKEFLPRLIFVDFDSLGECKGTHQNCAEIKKKGQATIAKLQAEGYHATKQGPIDYTFFKP